ncbi:MAG: type 4a pilus biogenesis protein PilO [Candidatus Nealsonbacteria bacterium]|nr:type 4a pilus biogenesis protein PilO [Candidatus Nealsonbacteria bacterium]
MDLFSKNKILIAHLLTFLVFALIVVFFVRPLWMDIKSNAKQLFETKRDFEFIKEKSDKINLVRSDYKRMESDLSKMSGFLIDPKTPIDLIKFWESTAKEESLNIDIGSYPLEKVDSDLWPSMGFQVKLTGSYSSFMRFLKKVESSQYFFEVKSLSIVKSAEKVNEKTNQAIPGGVSASLGLKVYTK